MKLGRPRLKRLLWSIAAGVVFFFLTFSVAWFMNEHFVWPILPGYYLVGAIRKLTGLRSERFSQSMFFVMNVLFWSAVFYGIGSIVSRVRRGPGASSLSA